MQEHQPLKVSVARPEDARAWIELRQAAHGHPMPGDMASEIERFNSAPPSVANDRYIVRVGHEPVACVELHRLGNVVELRDVAIAREYLHIRGVEVVEEMSRWAMRQGSVLTAEYPEAYGPLFVGAGFRQNTRTRMARSLANYQAQAVVVPQGVQLRRPRPEDEPAVAAMAYRNYADTPDADMVSSSPEQAASIIRAMFGGAYSRFMAECSCLAEDEGGSLVGSCLVGDVSRDDGERTAWVLDISVGPEWRGKGLGRAMLVNALNVAKRAGFERTGLMVTIGNSRAQALYQSLGLEEYGDIMYEGVLKS